MNNLPLHLLSRFLKICYSCLEPNTQKVMEVPYFRNTRTTISFDKLKIKGTFQVFLVVHRS